MKKDLQSRLNELAWNITSIGNFNYAPQYGHKIASIQSLAERVADEFPGVYEVISSTYPIVDVINLNGVASIDPNKISKWEREVGKILMQLRKDPSYQALLKAYNKDNQIEIAELLPDVFVNLGTQNLLEPGQKAPLLFHGITVPRSIGAQEYLDLCLKIQREGIKPSPYGLHMDMDSQIRPIFLTPKPYNAHGLIALSFKPDSHAVVVEKNDYEAKIYSKKLNANFELALRDADTLFSHGPDNDAGVPKNQAEEYVKGLAGLLNERNIPFKRIMLPSN